ncbi:glycosyl transferase group 1 [Anaeromyxobacter dehalogenans 2CP-1]|uniref:Glycosyl transferase group 1 n=1 Tax=Anaeromyxobacter dehalogenans (strain ATCC BAA-258 / DSM 21875 / 2CP-1) TaxID=455488 RepID=B8JF70_ANAD2|nr:GNAT family N-acetyltransferase [Anaeromyxobacter dehalogenans]ACL64427.1 glycosyl transferase group 1 [Anaeromyxobacter dehalogenans 2CP-1]
MALTILGVSYALAPPVGPDAIGGAEQVLALVAGALARRGHRSIVVAPRGSDVAGRLVATEAPPGPFDAGARARAEQVHRDAVQRALAAERVDLVHLHGLGFGAMLPVGPPPVVALHLHPACYPEAALRAGAPLVCVSESQARALPEGVRAHEVIPNGVPLDAYRPGGDRGAFALVLARICPEKGVAPALAAARAAGLPLLVGGIAFPYPEHLRYLEEEVKPLLDRDRRLLGPVGRAEKALLLRAARCVVVPSLAPETSSLVAMEALASGTPVVARRIGALPEIVEDGRTGFLVDRDDELGPAMRDAARLSAADCRAAAERRFSAAVSGGRWVALVERLARRPRPRATRLETVAGAGALEALRGEWSALCDRAAATPFQRPEWLLPWCRAFGVASPRAVVARRAGRLVALAPLVQYEDAGRRMVTLLGSGLSDYQDAVVDPGDGPDGAALVGALLGAAAGADALLLEHLPDRSPLRAALGQWRGAGAAAPDGVCPVLALPADPDALDRSLAPRLAENVRYGRRRLARAGATFTTAGPGDLERHLEALFSLHAARWGARGERGVLAGDAIRRFHLEAARGLLARGLLRLHVLWVGGRPAAAFHGFVDGDRAYYYVGGFDPAHRAASPGAVIVAHAAASAIAEGARELDFLRGPEPYKHAWGARDRPAWRAVLPVPRRWSARAGPAAARVPSL